MTPEHQWIFDGNGNLLHFLRERIGEIAPADGDAINEIHLGPLAFERYGVDRRSAQGTWPHRPYWVLIDREAPAWSVQVRAR